MTLSSAVDKQVYDTFLHSVNHLGVVVLNVMTPDLDVKKVRLT